MREFLKTKGFKMTPQRELIFRSFFEKPENVSLDELYGRVRARDRSIGFSTVWRNMKLICEVGLAEEVNLGDGVTRYSRVSREPQAYLICQECRKVTRANVAEFASLFASITSQHGFEAETTRLECIGLCAACLVKGSSTH